MRVDIAIIGGGLVGASLACSLAQQSFSIAIVDPGMQEGTTLLQDRAGLQKSCTRSRALVLSASTVRSLESMALWASIGPKTTAVSQIHVSQQQCFAKTRIRAVDYGLKSLGQVIEAHDLMQIFSQHLLKIENLRLLAGSTLSALEKQQDHWKLRCSSGETVEATLLVAADGTHSFVRSSLGIAASVRHYTQHALMCTLRLDQAHQGIAYERWTNDGSIAMLPLAHQRVKCVWVLPQARAEAMAGLKPTFLCREIQACFGYYLGVLAIEVPEVFKNAIQVVPLLLMQSSTVYDHQVVFLGNAANTLHPIAAQGFNMGFRDASCLAEQLIAARAEDELIASVKVLRAYATARQRDHIETRRWTELLAQPGYQRLGLWASYVPALKHWIVQHYA